jgi:hypothetical protein
MAGGCQVGTDLAKAPALAGRRVCMVQALRQPHGLGMALSERFPPSHQPFLSPLPRGVADELTRAFIPVSS